MYLQKDSESDYDDSIENTFSSDIATTSSTNEFNHTINVKAELIDYSLPTKIPEIEKIQTVFGKSFPFEDSEKENLSNESVEVKQEFDDTIAQENKQEQKMDMTKEQKMEISEEKTMIQQEQKTEVMQEEQKIENTENEMMQQQEEKKQQNMQEKKMEQCERQMETDIESEAKEENPN